MFTLASGCSVSSIEGEPGKEVEGLASLGEQKRDDHRCCARLATGEWRGSSGAASENTRTRRSGCLRWWLVGLGEHHHPFITAFSFPGFSYLRSARCINVGDAEGVGLIPWSGRPPGGGHGNPLQYSSLRISWTEEPGRIHRPWGHKESDTTERLSTHQYLFDFLLAILISM